MASAPSERSDGVGRCGIGVALSTNMCYSIGCKDLLAFSFSKDTRYSRFHLLDVATRILPILASHLVDVGLLKQEPHLT